MFAFKIWGHFASFRDPLTISQNLSLLLPPKTTVGGMMASILGIENYFNDKNYFDFGYSCIVLNEIRKKSFSQNYIDKYTNKISKKLTAYDSVMKKYREVEKIKKKIEGLKDSKGLKQVQFAKRQDRIQKETLNYEKKLHSFFLELDKLHSKQNEIFIKSKPTNRELILTPSYLIVIDNFKYEQEIIDLLKKHQSIFPFYLGNSEFPGNFKYVEMDIIENSIDEVHSFTPNIDLIEFRSNQKYSNLTIPLKVEGNRQYRDFKKVIFSNKIIHLKKRINGVKIKLTLEEQGREFGCDFI
ncbi:MAG TPA: CRISPR-associated protein Cas5 [Crocinitomix sp.]|nr:CRISPR-associated protein Cas5 [Crocinitomix sp.]